MSPDRAADPALTPEAEVALDDQERLVLACAYSRHNDGHVRQAALTQMLASETWWTIPFVVQLLGGCVAEIASDIADYAKTGLTQNPSMRTEFARFFADNPDFIELTAARATSYWAEYHRYEHIDCATFPSLVALRALQGDAGQTGA